MALTLIGSPASAQPLSDYDNTGTPDLLSPVPPTANPVVFVSAHQDDETLTFGAEIENHKNAGRYIISVLVTDGAASGVRASTGLSVNDFARARNLEYFSAISEQHVDTYRYEGLRDSGVTQAQANAVAAKWVALYPSGSFKVPSDRDSHPDHQKIGAAFRAQKNANPSLDIRFYVKPEQQSDPWAMTGTYKVVGGPRTVAAAAEYKVVNTGVGRYGVGYLSTPWGFDAIMAAPVSYWHF